MKLSDVKNDVQKYIYMEDTAIIDVAVASVISTRLKIGEPLWLTVIGASSGGKSQIIRPIANTDPEFIIPVDDLTENTLLSGASGKSSKSLLTEEFKQGMFSISDLTVLLSKSPESRATILSQLRLLYDGKMVKHSGNSEEPLVWEGYLGIISGSTPSIYSMFEEVSDMGERFIYYRMKEYDPKKATELALTRGKYGKELDAELSETYKEYIMSVVQKAGSIDMDTIKLTPEVRSRIIDVATFAEQVRTTVQTNKYGSDHSITRIPVTAMPMRVSLQLENLARTMMLMKLHDTGDSTLEEEQLEILDWVGYSLANEEKRACMKELSRAKYESGMQAEELVEEIGLSSHIISGFLENLVATKILYMANGRFFFAKREYVEFIRRVEGTSGLDDNKIF